MSMIGKLSVAITGDAADFNKTIKDVQKESAALGKSIEKHGLSIAKLGAGLATFGTAAVSALLGVTMAAKDSLLQIDNLSKTTGIAREQLQGLAYAAQQEDASIESLAVGLKKLSKNMMDASQGSGDAEKVLKAFGISVLDGNKGLRDSIDVMLDVSDKFKKMQSVTEKSALAMTLFGKSGAELVPFLSLGREEIEKLIKEAQDLGYVIDEETVKAFDTMDDQISSIKAGFTGMGRSIAKEVLPVLVDLTANLKESVKQFASLPDDVKSSIIQFTGLASVLAIVSGFVLSIISKLPALIQGIGLLKGAFTPFAVGSAIITGLLIIVDAFKKMAHNANVAKKAINQLSSTSEFATKEAQIKSRIAQLEQKEKNSAGGGDTKGGWLAGGIGGGISDTERKELQKLRKELYSLRVQKQTVTSETDTTDTIEETDDPQITSLLAKLKEEKVKKPKETKDETDWTGGYSTWEDYIAAQKNAARSAAYQAAIEKRITDEKEKQRQEQEFIQDLINNNFNKGLVNAPEQYVSAWKTSLDETLKSFGDFESNIANMAADTAQSMKTALDDGFFNIIKGNFQDLGNVIQNFLDSILRSLVSMYTNTMVQKIMSGVVGNWMGGLFNASPSFAGGFTPGTRAGIASTPKGMFAGGSVLAGREYTVGEFGRERFVPATNGTIIPSGASTPNVSVVINNNGQPVTASAGTPQMNGNDLLIPILIDGINKNKQGVRDVIGGIRK